MHDPVVLSEAFVAALSRSQFAQAIAQCDDAVQANLPLVELVSFWKRLVTKVGRFVSYEPPKEVRDEAHPAYRIFYVDCRFERGTYTIQLWFNQQSKISGMVLDNTRPIP
ncbi:MAG: DUF3887 domain-containing protein [Myxococcales bacterium]|nr:DUF3887 domain-containing protein [Myxococcales bacterium]